VSQIDLIGQEDIETLVKLGLNASQAKIYLTLLHTGTVAAKKLSQITKIDSGEIYRQLESLERKGLIERVLKFPLEYTPTPLSDGLTLLTKQRNEDNIALQKRINILLEKNSKLGEEKQDSFQFSIIPKNRINCPSYQTKKHKEVQKESLWYAQIQNMPSSIEKGHEFWDKNTNKKAHLRAIAEYSAHNNSILAYLEQFKTNNKYFDYRISDPTLGITFWINDSREVYIDTNEGAEALWTNNPIIVKTFRELFEIKWKTAKTNLNQPVSHTIMHTGGEERTG
jgi:hypothetical protein